LAHLFVRHDLVDEYVLLIHPLMLGSGHRLFPDDGVFVELGLVDVKATTTGVIIATYQSPGPTATGQ
jgi:dihydrofolate reductase